MTGPVRITSVLKAYTEVSRIDYKSRGPVLQIQDRVRISGEGVQKSKEFLSGLKNQTYSKEDAASKNAVSSRQADDNLEILNLSSNAGMDQIHRAYLSAIKKYHPDKFGSLDPEFRKLAEEKSKQIILAYEKLTKFSAGSV